MVITPLTLHAAMKADPGLHGSGRPRLSRRPRASGARLRQCARLCAHPARSCRAAFADPHRAKTSSTRPMKRPSKSPAAGADRRSGKGALSHRRNFALRRGPDRVFRSLRRTVESAEKAQARGGQISGVTSGFADIDSLLGGLQPSDLIILAGRPGMGKTSLAHQHGVPCRARLRAGCRRRRRNAARLSPVLFFSLEMAAQQLSARILSEQTEIEMWKIRNGKFSESEWENFVLKMQDLSHSAALHRRHRRHFDRADRGARPPSEARKEDRSHHHRLYAAGRAVAPCGKPGAGNHRRSPRA